MAEFRQKIDIFERLLDENKGALVSKINFGCMVASTALMTYFYRISCHSKTLKDKYGYFQGPERQRFYKYLTIAAGALATYHFILYPKYPLKEAENKLNIPSKFNLSKEWRFTIATCIAIPALIIEVLGWREIGMAPIDPDKQEFIGYKELFGGIYNHIRHPIYFAEFSWFYTLSLLMNNPFCLLISGLIMQPACYDMCRQDEIECESRFGNEYKKYKEHTGFWFPKL